MENPRDGWATEDWLWQAVLRGLEMPEFDVDPCSNPWATVPAKIKIMRPENGLKYRLKEGETAWMNYPYSQSKKWFGWAYNQAGRVVGIGPLTLETKAWRDYGPDDGLSLGRVRFRPPPGVEESSPKQQHTLLFYRVEPEVRHKIIHEFAKIMNCSIFKLERVPLV